MDHLPWLMSVEEPRGSPWGTPKPMYQLLWPCALHPPGPCRPQSLRLSPPRAVAVGACGMVWRGPEENCEATW